MIIEKSLDSTKPGGDTRLAQARKGELRLLKTSIVTSSSYNIVSNLTSPSYWVQSEKAGRIRFYANGSSSFNQ